jgi:hypothetical protein
MEGRQKANWIDQTQRANRTPKDRIRAKIVYFFSSDGVEEKYIKSSAVKNSGEGDSTVIEMNDHKHSPYYGIMASDFAQNTKKCPHSNILGPMVKHCLYTQENICLGLLFYRWEDDRSPIYLSVAIEEYIMYFK